MAQFRWAHVNCDEDPAVTIAGPTGSLQFITGSDALSGSSNLMFYTASFGTYSANTLVLNGDMVIDGAITASMFVVDQTDTISGSTIFGNSNDDYHIRTGSFYVGQSASAPTFQVNPSLSQSITLGMRHTYRNVAASGQTSSTGDYVIGIGGSGAIEFRLHSASIHDSGAILVIKDEITSRVGGITLSASSPNLIDNNGAYSLTGTMAAISLYSNGSNWFVF